MLWFVKSIFYFSNDYWLWTNWIYFFIIISKRFCLIKNHAIGIDFANTCSIFKPGIVFIHDIYCKIYKDDFHTFRDNQLLEQPVESPERILEKYTYDNAAEQLIACLDF